MYQLLNLIGSVVLVSFVRGKVVRQWTMRVEDFRRYWPHDAKGEPVFGACIRRKRTKSELKALYGKSLSDKALGVLAEADPNKVYVPPTTPLAEGAARITYAMPQPKVKVVKVKETPVVKGRKKQAA